MVDEGRSTEAAEPAPSESAPPQDLPRTGWLVAGFVVAAHGGLVVGVAEPVIRMWGHRGLMTPWMWIEALSFSSIGHWVYGGVACAVACLVGGLVARLSERVRRRLVPGAVACSAFIVAEAAAFLSVLAFFSFDARLPAGALPMAVLPVVWVLVLVPVSRVLARFGSRGVGRRLARVSRVSVWPVVLLASAAVIVKIEGRSRLHPLEGDLSAATTASPPTSQHAGRLPDIVLVVFDTLRLDRLGCYGYEKPTSPRIDAFADDAVLYRWAFSPGVWTLPAHASMFTGLFPTQHGADFGQKRLWLDDRFTTLAEALRDRGYQTMALSNNPLVSPWTNLTQGFERFADPCELAYIKRNSLYEFIRFVLKNDGPLGPLLGRWFYNDAGGRMTATLAARWLAARDRSRPFLLFVNYMEAHRKYEPPHAYRQLFLPPEHLSRSYRVDQSDPAVWQYALAGKPIYTAADLGILSALYDARVRELDDHFGDLMRVLAAEVMLDDTIVILTADHGEHLGEHRMLDHQYSVHNILVHVPLIVRWPRALRRQRVDSLVQTHDIFPTLLGWAGVKPEQPGKIMARSLAEALSSKRAATSRPAYVQYLKWPTSQLEMLKRIDPGFDPTPWEVSYYVTCEERWKLIARQGGEVDLYDMWSDPGENHNIRNARLPTAERIYHRLLDWTDSFETFDPNQGAGEPSRQATVELRQRLRDLGYVH